VPNRHLRLLILVLLGTLAYAVVRYNVLQSVAWSNLPLFIGNKAVSFAGILLITLSYLTRAQEAGRFFGLAGFAAALLHTVMSFPLLSPPYYPTMYAGGRFNLSGELLLLTGALSLACFALAAVTSLPGMQEYLGRERWLGWQRAGYPGLLLAALHVLLRGSAGWFRPDTWPAYMPPITLLTFMIALLPVLVKLRRSGAR
jgi:DMSO/TMAO reductase YedYZ heme-binding membrane subunit